MFRSTILLLAVAYLVFKALKSGHQERRRFLFYALGTAIVAAGVTDSLEIHPGYYLAGMFGAYWMGRCSHRRTTHYLNATFWINLCGFCAALTAWLLNLEVGTKVSLLVFSFLLFIASSGIFWILEESIEDVVLDKLDQAGEDLVDNIDFDDVG